MKKRDIDLKTSSEASREARFLFSIVAFFLLFRSVRAGKPGFRPGKPGFPGCETGFRAGFRTAKARFPSRKPRFPPPKPGFHPAKKLPPKPPWYRGSDCTVHTEESGAGPGGSSSNSNENFVKNELPVHGLPSSRATIAGNPVPGMTHLHGGASQQPVHHTSA